MTAQGKRSTAFWKWLAIVSAVLAVPQLLWTPARVGGVFLLVLAVCAGGEFLMCRLAHRHAFFRFASTLGLALFSLFIASFLLVQIMIFAGMRPDAEAAEADAVLVLGARVYESGTPSATLTQRLHIAQDYLNAHPDAIAVLCGGQGSNEPFPEAIAMREYLLSRGIADSRLILEDASNNTIQNIANAKRLLEARFPDDFRTAVISSDFHLARARRLMLHAGLDPYAIPAPTPYFTQRVALHLREYGSVMGLILTGRW